MQPLHKSMSVPSHHLPPPACELLLVDSIVVYAGCAAIFVECTLFKFSFTGNINSFKKRTKKAKTLTFLSCTAALLARPGCVSWYKMHRVHPMKFKKSFRLFFFLFRVPRLAACLGGGRTFGSIYGPSTTFAAIVQVVNLPPFLPPPPCLLCASVCT